MEYSTFEQFQLIVEQLDLCSNLYQKKSNPSYRISLILLDNVSEIILYRYFQDKFSHDSFTKWIVPPSISDKDKIKVLSYFDDKVKVAYRNRLLSKCDALIIKIAHHYRNESFHKDSHNPSAINVLSRLMFSAVLNLFIKTNGGIISNISEGVDKNNISFFTKYGISTSFISYSEAAKTISKSLALKKKPPLSSIKRTLAEDVEERTKRCLKILTNIFPLLRNESVDTALKLFEFKTVHPDKEDEHSIEIRQIRYKVGKGNSTGITKQMWVNAERQFKERFEKELKLFKPNLTLRVIKNLLKAPSHIYRATNFEFTLGLYHDTDLRLSLAERVIDIIYTEWDSAIQMEVDIRRGK